MTRVDAAFAAVDRFQFIPDLIFDATDDGFTPVHRDVEPSRWEQLVASSEPVIIRIDGAQATSSSSALPVMAAMLDASRLAAGQRVLEIGTGTGFNAALLAHLVGAAHVTTVDVDSGLTDQAAVRLANTGFAAVTVAAADGAFGYEPGAPYDRVLATCKVTEIPRPWVQQTLDGGLIVTPYGNNYYNGALLALTVAGGVATGHFTDDTPAFMPMHSQRDLFGSVLAYAAPDDQWRHTTTIEYPHEVLNGHDCAFVISLHLPEVHAHVVPDSDGDPYHFRVWLIHRASGSVATVDVTKDAEEYSVRQRGPRSLHDEAYAAYHWWQDHGQPRRTQFGVTVTAHQQAMWLAGTDGHRIQIQSGRLQNS